MKYIRTKDGRITMRKEKKPIDQKYYISAGWHFSPTVKNIDLANPYETYEAVKLEADRLNMTGDCWAEIYFRKNNKWFRVSEFGGRIVYDGFLIRKDDVDEIH